MERQRFQWKRKDGVKHGASGGGVRRAASQAIPERFARQFSIKNVNAGACRAGSKSHHPMKPTPIRQSSAWKLPRTVFLPRFFAALLTLCGFGKAALADSKVFVTNSGNDTVSVISLATRAVVATIPVGDNPLHVAVTPDGARAYVSNRNSNNVSVIDTSTLAVVATVAVGTAPTGLAASSNGKQVYVANSGSANISVIDRNTHNVIFTIPTPAAPNVIAFHPVHHEFWVGFDTVGTVLQVYSAADHSVLASVTSSDRAYASTGLTFRPDGSEAFGSEGCGACGRFHRLSGQHSGGTIAVIEADILEYIEDLAREILPIQKTITQRLGSKQILHFEGLQFARTRGLESQILRTVWKKSDPDKPVNLIEELKTFGRLRADKSIKWSTPLLDKLPAALDFAAGSHFVMMTETKTPDWHQIALLAQMAQAKLPANGSLFMSLMMTEEQFRSFYNALPAENPDKRILDEVRIQWKFADEGVISAVIAGYFSLLKPLL